MFVCSNMLASTEPLTFLFCRYLAWTFTAQCVSWQRRLYLILLWASLGSVGSQRRPSHQWPRSNSDNTRESLGHLTAPHIGQPHIEWATGGILRNFISKDHDFNVEIGQIPLIRISHSAEYRLWAKQSQPHSAAFTAAGIQLTSQCSMSWRGIFL